MTGSRSTDGDRPTGDAGALYALTSALHAHRDAMAAGDLSVMRASHERVRTLLCDPRWRQAARDDADAAGLRAALRATAGDAALALRGEAHASRALASLGLSSGVYTAAGGLARGPGAPRGPRA